MVKTGIGYDVHSLKKGESLLLGGVKISSSIGVIAHSDGDVLLHAMVDALLGAAALGDLGKYFPSSDAQWKEKSSLFFLRYAAELLFKKGYNIDHIDSTIVLERPKISDKISEMIANISNAIKLEKSSLAFPAGSPHKCI